MRQSVVFLLLCVLANAGEATGSKIRGEDCRRGAAVIGEFYENPCDGDSNPFPDRWLSLSEIIGEPKTVAKMRSYLLRHCSVTMPQTRRCFADIISECEADQQRYLNNLALNTSIVCEVNSSDLSPWLELVLSSLTDQQFADDASCRMSDSVRRGIARGCREQAVTVHRLRDLPDSYLQTASVRELAPLIHSLFSMLVECQIRKVRDDPQRCPSWRGQALELVLPLTGPPPLGLRLNFTEAQAAELFELN